MSVEADIALLRRFEPVLRFTRGEQFFPMDVEPYVRLCSLWTRRPSGEITCLVEQGKLTLPLLTRSYPDEFGAVQFLKLTDPLTPAELAIYYLNRRRSRKDPQDVFRAGRGRLARVGYLSRIADALFNISLLARGRVPGAGTAAANIIYNRVPAGDRRYCYFGRIVRQNGWTALQYWFFYLFDNWRSSFFGANDHEADWELICVFLSESETGEVSPEWAAYAAHDQVGDDIRRRWDDPELERIGEHPVVYIGAGSHASYFKSGEYLSEIVLPFLAPYSRIADHLRRFWYEKLGQFAQEETHGTQTRESSIFRIPFVDYARGDGLTIGPGQAREWDTPRLLSPPPQWVTSYRGLWGLYARDPFEGEDAPAGPMYNRDGTVRRKWYDPLGWVGLDKLPPSGEVLGAVRRQEEEVGERQSAVTLAVEEKTREMHRLSVEAAALQGQPQLGKLYQAHNQRIRELSKEVDQLRAQLAADAVLVESLGRYAERLREGAQQPARAHIRRANQPASDSERRSGRLAEIWAATSVGLMLIAFVGVVLFARQYLVHWAIIIVLVFVTIDAYFRGWLTRLVTGITLGLAAATGLVLLYEFYWLAAVLAVFAAGGYLVWDNLRELWT